MNLNQSIRGYLFRKIMKFPLSATHGWLDIDPILLYFQYDILFQQLAIDKNFTAYMVTVKIQSAILWNRAFKVST